MPAIKENYYQTQLSKLDDVRIDEAKLDSTMPEGYVIFDNPAIRMADSMINLNGIVNAETGKTMAEEYGAPFVFLFCLL